MAAGLSFSQATATAAFKSGDSIAQLVARFNAQGLAALDIASGRQRRIRYDSAARSHMVQKVQRPLACRQDGTAT